MICGHGSRDVRAVHEFGSLARGLAARLPEYDVESGFLEFATPVIREGLDALRKRGNERVLAVPGMLMAAGHVKNDIPSVLRTYEARHPEMEIRYARELSIDPKLLRAAGDRIEAALRGAEHRVRALETLLMVVGRGTSDSDANSNVSKVMRMLWEGFGFGWGETCYSGVTFPLVEPALEHAVRLGYRRIVVFPYFLFTGVLVERIYAYTDRVAGRHPETEFLKADYLNDHPLVVDAFRDRVEEAVAGENRMNCQLCKYREQLLGFEAEVGLPQESHHHHVEGVGVGTTFHSDSAGGHRHSPGHSHAPGRGHTHGQKHSGHDHREGGSSGQNPPEHPGEHGHHPYPHADHPLGPRTLVPGLGAPEPAAGPALEEGGGAGPGASTRAGAASSETPPD